MKTLTIIKYSTKCLQTEFNRENKLWVITQRSSHTESGAGRRSAVRDRPAPLPVCIAHAVWQRVVLWAGAQLLAHHVIVSTSLVWRSGAVRLATAPHCVWYVAQKSIVTFKIIKTYVLVKI